MRATTLRVRYIQQNSQVARKITYTVILIAFNLTSIPTAPWSLRSACPSKRLSQCLKTFPLSS
jgi:hypothetical protein